VISSVSQKTKSVFGCFPTDLKRFQYLKNKDVQAGFSIESELFQYLFNRPKALSTVFSTDPKLFQQLFQQTQIVLHIFEQS
jgi:hypothetical protein